MNSTSRLLERGELGREIPRLGDHRTRGRAEVDPELAGDDLGEGGLAQAGRPDEQHVVERLALALGGFDEHLEVLAQRRLAGEVGEHLRTQRGVEIVVAAQSVDEAGMGVGHARGSSLRVGSPLC